MINAVEFYKEFKKQVLENNIDENGNTYLDIYRNDSQYTELINKTLIPEIIKSLDKDLTVQHEYFRIDTIGWKGKYLTLDKETSKDVGLNRHLWDLKIAVEHENSKTDWLDEVIKLVHIRCPLKVIIAYNYCDQRDELEIKKLSYVSKCMNMVEAFKDSIDKEEYLIIIGNGAPKNRKNSSYTNFDYRGYIYNSHSKIFEEVILQKEKTSLTI